MTVKFTTVPSKRLSETINASAYSFSLQDIKGWNGSNVAASDFGTDLYASFRNSLGTKMELMKIDPSTIASSSITILKRGLGFDGDQTTEVTANIQDVWVKGDTLVELGSHVSQLLEETVRKSGDATIAGDFTFSNHSPSIPTESSSETGRAASIGYVNGVAISGAPDSSNTVKGILKTSVAPVSSTSPIAVGDNDPRVPTQDENNALAGTSGTPVDATNKLVDNADTSSTAAASKIIRADSNKKIDPAYIQSFSGNGSDGALTVSSGVTNIDLGAAQVVIKNYTSVSITGTGQVTCSNPHANGTLLIIKSQGGVTLTSSTIPNFDMSGMGGAAGSGGATSNGGSNQTNTAGTDATTIVTNYQGDSATSYGKGGAGSATTGGTAGTIFNNLFMYTLSDITLSNRRVTIAPGFGGGGGAGGQSQLNATSAGGAGGRGGGALVIQCGGALNFTSALGVDVSGKNGTAASNVSTTGQTGAGGGGGGGGSGMCLILYNTLTAASGTVNAKGGTGGAGGNTTTTTANGSASGAGGGGSGGGTYASAGGAGGAAGAVGNNNGSAGGTVTGGAGGGGGGGASGSGSATATGGAGGTSSTSTSLWLITKNNYFA